MVTDHGGCCFDDPDATISQWAKTEPIANAILRAISKKKGETIDMEALEPLYPQIDPEALDAFLSHARAQDSPATVTFAFSGYQVALSQDGTICVSDE